MQNGVHQLHCAYAEEEESGTHLVAAYQKVVQILQKFLIIYTYELGIGQAWFWVLEAMYSKALNLSYSSFTCSFVHITQQTMEISAWP